MTFHHITLHHNITSYHLPVRKKHVTESRISCDTLNDVLQRIQLIINC